MGCRYDGKDWGTPEIKAEPPTPETIANCKGLTINDQGHIVKDNVNNPSHYADKQIEVIDYIKDTLTAEQYQGYLLGNALKYISRAGKKDLNKYTEDLRKCVWYLQREIKRSEGDE